MPRGVSAHIDQARAERDARAEAMAAMFRDGQTLQQIGDHYGITRERVRQLLGKIGVERVEGGSAVRALRSAEVRAKVLHERRDQRAMRQYGCDHATAIRCNGGKSFRARGGLADAFLTQRHSAGNRGVAWEITFPEWVAAWQASGHLDSRGRGRGRYVMARFGDAGPYSPSNIYFTTCEGNGADYQRTRLAKLGREVRGWVVRKGCINRPYLAAANGKQIGYFATAEAAHEAYLAAKAA